MESVIMSIFEPGVNSQVIVVINVALVALIGVLIALAFITAGNIHVIALALIAAGLLASIQWYLFLFLILILKVSCRVARI